MTELEEASLLVEEASRCYKKAIAALKLKPSLEAADQALAHFEEALILSEDAAMLVPSRSSVLMLTTLRSQIAELKRLRAGLC